MRKLLIAGLAVASLTGIGYAQVERNADTQAARQLREADQVNAQVNSLPSTCVDASGIARNIGDRSTVGTTEFQCVRTLGDGMKPKGADWILVQPVVWTIRRSF